MHNFPFDWKCKRAHACPLITMQLLNGNMSFEFSSLRNFKDEMLLMKLHFQFYLISFEFKCIKRTFSLYFAKLEHEWKRTDCNKNRKPIDDGLSELNVQQQHAKRLSAFSVSYRIRFVQMPFERLGKTALCFYCGKLSVLKTFFHRNCHFPFPPRTNQNPIETQLS